MRVNCINEEELVQEPSDNTSNLGNMNFDSAARFIRGITGSNETVTYETFAENETETHPPDWKDPLKKVIHGPFEKHADWLVELNKQGAGVFLVLNDVNCQTRVTENVVNIRAVLVRVHESSVGDVEQCGLEPHIITEEAVNNYCCFWLVSDVSPEMFPPIQGAIAERFNSDPDLTDPALLVRIPGFINHKEEPFRVKLRRCKDFAPYTIEQIIDGLEIKPLIQAREHEKVPVKMAPVGDCLAEDDAVACAPRSPEPEAPNESQDLIEPNLSDPDWLGPEIGSNKTPVILPEMLRIDEKYRDCFLLWAERRATVPRHGP